MCPHPPFPIANVCSSLSRTRRRTVFPYPWSARVSTSRSDSTAGSARPAASGWRNISRPCSISHRFARRISVRRSAKARTVVGGPLAVSYGAGTYDEIVRYRWRMRRQPRSARFRCPRRTVRYNALRPHRETGADARTVPRVKGGIRSRRRGHAGFERAFVYLGRIRNYRVHHERVTDFWTAHTRKVQESARGMVDLIFTGTTSGTSMGFFFLFPCGVNTHAASRAAQAVVHEYGARVIYHLTGGLKKRCRPAEMGIDVLQALQFDGRHGPVVLKDR